MFAGSQEILTIRQTGDRAFTQVATALRAAGLSVVQSFDLQSAAADPAACSCGCQMRVLLVYGQDGPPVTLLLDSSLRQTTLSLVNDLARAAPPEWVGRLPAILGG